MLHLYRQLADVLSVSRQTIKRFMLSAPKKYKVYTIPKRTSGQRTIAHPARALKDYQRALVGILEPHLPVHEAAFAYKKNLGIKDNAQRHQHSMFLLKMDFANFFHSITPDLLFSILQRLGLRLSEAEKALLTQLLFWSPSKVTDDKKLVLSIGAPSSPLISNVIMVFFDQDMAAICQQQNITYSRYADDISFSTRQKHSLFTIPDQVRKLLLQHFDGLMRVNENKTVFSSKAHNRHITGVTLTNDNKLSIGRQRKRYISSLIHKFSLGQLPLEEVDYLQGMFAFACDIEPEFKVRMINKYSQQTIVKIIKGME